MPCPTPLSLDETPHQNHVTPLQLPPTRSFPISLADRTAAHV